MVFGISSDKYSDAHIDEVKELKNQIKLVELDLEKRMILLENSMNSIQNSLGTIDKFESSKDAIIDIQETKKTLREIEDIGLISKLETISNSDKISAISDIVDEANEKIKLLSDAMEILGESKSLNGGVSAPDNKEISSINSEIDSLKNALSKVSSSVTDPQKISELYEHISSLEKSNAAVNAELKKMYDLYHEKISFLEKRISHVSSPSGLPGAGSEDISKMNAEIEYLKNSNKKLVELIELSSKVLGNQKNIKTENGGYADLRPILTSLSMKIADVKKEMDLERAMYPKDIMNIKKDMNDVKAVQKSLTDSIDSIMKVKKESIGASNHNDKLQNIENSINGISGKISEISSLNDKIKALNNEINLLKANKSASMESDTNYKKLVDIIEKNPTAFTESKDPKTEGAGYKNLVLLVTDLSNKVAEIKTEMNLERALYPQDITNIKKDMNNVKEVQKSLTDTVESIAKTKKGSIDVPDYKDKIKNIETSVNGISGKISEISSLNDKIKALNNEINLLKANKNKKTEYAPDRRQMELQRNEPIETENKKASLFEKSLKDIAEKIDDMQNWKDGIQIIENRIDSVERASNAIAQHEMRIKESARNEEMLSNRLKSIADENKSLRQEIEQLKQVCAQIMNDNQQQPIIID